MHDKNLVPAGQHSRPASLITCWLPFLMASSQRIADIRVDIHPGLAPSSGMLSLGNKDTTITVTCQGDVCVCIGWACLQLLVTLLLWLPWCCCCRHCCCRCHFQA